jgi:tetratricopeptide (TPR) repeat protein
MKRSLTTCVWSASIVVVLLLSTQDARAGLRETFEAGNEAFGLGDYDRAIQSYEELVEHGVWDADVFYNLGTTYARMGRYGHAILNLERALLIDPGHEDALDNVRTVRRALARRRTAAGEDADLDPPRSFWMNVLNRVTASQVVIPFILCYVVFFGLLAARRLTSSELARLVLLIVSLVLGVAVLAGGALVFSKAAFDAEVREAIAVNEGEAVLREGPGERFRRAIEAREGDRLRVLNREGDWIHLRDSGGTEGWGHADDFGELRRE